MITLFHGTTMEVREPLVGVGRKKVDFGRGFYLTKMRRQASLWAETIAERRMAGTPVLNEYKFDIDLAKELAGSRYKVFTAYDREWLNYVVDCRRGGKLQKQYNVVEGGVANDKVIDTVEDYEKGVITVEQALGQLAHREVNHQIAILSQAIVDKCLKFKGSVVLGSQGGRNAR